MNESSTPPDSERLSMLEKRFEKLTSLEEDLLTHKVYRVVYEKLIWMLKIFTAVAVIIIAAIGYQSYREIIKEGSQQAARIFSDKAVVEIANEARRQANQQLSVLSAEFRASINAKVDQQAAEIFALYQQKFDEALKKASIPASPQIKVAGFVLYGEGHKNDEGNWVWDNRNFDIEKAPKESFPHPGIIAISVKPAVVREQPPTVTFTEQKLITKIPVFANMQLKFREQTVAVTKIPKFEDRGGPPVATLSSGQQVKVEEVKVLLDRFLWARISTL